MKGREGRQCRCHLASRMTCSVQIALMVELLRDHTPEKFLAPQRKLRAGVPLLARRRRRLSRHRSARFQTIIYRSEKQNSPRNHAAFWLRARRSRDTSPCAFQQTRKDDVEWDDAGDGKRQARAMTMEMNPPARHSGPPGRLHRILPFQAIREDGCRRNGRDSSQPEILKSIEADQIQPASHSILRPG